MNKLAKIGIFLFFVIGLLFVLFLFSKTSSKNLDNFSNYSLENNSINNSLGVLTLVFDDGHNSTYGNVYPLMKKYGYNGTVFILTNQTKLEGHNLMSFEDAKILQEQGWEIGSHGLNHVCFTDIEVSEAKSSIIESKKILESHGIEVFGFAYPYGCNNNESNNFSKENYLYWRALNWGYNSLTPDRNKIYSKWVDGKNNVSEICNWIINAKKENRWLLLTFHSVSQRKINHYDFNIRDFEEVLECINQSQIETKTIRRFIDEI